MSQRPLSQKPRNEPRNGKGNSQGQQQDTSQLLHKLNNLQAEVGRVAKALSNAGHSKPTGMPSGKGQSQGKSSRLDLRIQGVGLQKKQPLMLRPKNVASNTPRNRANRVSTGNRVMTFGRIQKQATVQGGIRTRRSQRARQVGQERASITLAGRVVAPQASQVLRARNRLQTQKNAGQGFILKKPINQIRVEKPNSNGSAKTSNRRKKNRMPQPGQPLVMRPLRIQVVKSAGKNVEKKGASKGASNPMKRRFRPRKERKDKEGGKDAAATEAAEKPAKDEEWEDDVCGLIYALDANTVSKTSLWPNKAR